MASVRDPDSHEILAGTYSAEQLKVIQSIYDPKREDEMEKRLRCICLDNPNGKIVFVTGIIHLLSLRKRLKDLKPRLLTLDKVLPGDFE